jgi:hypothetical protein
MKKRKNIQRIVKALTNPPKGNNTVTWTVDGSNWTWKKRLRSNHCPIEIATLAIEDIWSKNPNHEQRIKQKYLNPNEEAPTVGLTLRVFHSQINKTEDQIVVSSVMALANAGFYKDAKKLEELSFQ